MEIEEENHDVLVAVDEKHKDTIQHTSNVKAVKRVGAAGFYNQFQGHPHKQLENIIQHLRSEHPPDTPFVFLAGDSSVDNKHWLYPNFMHTCGQFISDTRKGKFTSDAINQYETILDPPKMVRDVCYWMNSFLSSPSPIPPPSGSPTMSSPLLADGKRRGKGGGGGSEGGVRGVCVNTAVEATTLISRVGGCQACCIPSCGELEMQDELIVSHLRPTDYIVVSVGGNDVALLPSLCTILALLLCVITPWFLLCSFHPGIFYLKRLFCNDVQSYINKLTKKTKPKKIGVCMIYFPQEQNTDSWANVALCCLCYCCAPGHLQYRIRVAYRLATTQIRIKGTEVVPILLADVLDGKDSKDYVERVEPSEIGGKKMAYHILTKMGLLDGEGEER